MSSAVDYYNFLFFFPFAPFFLGIESSGRRWGDEVKKTGLLYEYSVCISKIKILCSILYIMYHRIQRLVPIYNID